MLGAYQASRSNDRVWQLWASSQRPAYRDSTAAPEEDHLQSEHLGVPYLHNIGAAGELDRGIIREGLDLRWTLGRGRT
jgi:hypothetical protein